MADELEAALAWVDEEVRKVDDPRWAPMPNLDHLRTLAAAVRELRDNLALSRNNEAAVMVEVADQRAVLAYAQDARRKAEADLAAARAVLDGAEAGGRTLREQWLMVDRAAWLAWQERQRCPASDS